MDEGDIATTEALRIASAASAWSHTFQGKPLSKVELDSVVLTEVLRLHLLQSGNRAGDISTEWRCVSALDWPFKMVSKVEACLFLTYILFSQVS